MPAGPRSPHLFRALRAFCLGAFFDLGRELESGADIPVALEEHGLAGERELDVGIVRDHAERFVECRDGVIRPAIQANAPSGGAWGNEGMACAVLLHSVILSNV